MKRTLLICLALLCATTFAFGKSYTQQGIAYLYDYKTKTKKPIGNVSITVAYAEPTTSRADGTFTLAFKDFGAGKHLVFAQQPFSPGLTVLNKKETDNWSTFEGRLTLIMCSKKDFDTCKQNYYDVGFKSITQLYDQKIAALKKESADYQRRLQELEEERDRIMDNLRNSADAMARIDQSELDDAMQEVLDLYERGEVEEAMQKLEDMKLEEKFLKTLDKKHEGERIVAEATEDSLLTLNKLRTSVDMYKNNGNWNKAAETLKLLADKLNAYDDVFEYAYFCWGQNDFQEAEVYWKKALDILEKRMDTDSNDFLYQRTRMLNNLGLLYHRTQRFTESEEMYKEALESRRRLAKDNPKAYESGMAETLHNLAWLYSDIQRFHESENLYKEALEIKRRLAKDNPKKDEPALTLHNLGLLYYKLQRFTDSEAMYKEALEIRRRLAKDNPKAHEPYVAMTLNNLAILYSDTQRFTESEKMYMEALEIYRRLAEDNPKAYEPDVARTLNNLALLYSSTQRLTESEKMYMEALEIRRRLAKDNPMAYEQDVAQSSSNIGFLMLQTKRYAEAIPLFEEALEIYRRMAETDPAQQQWYMGVLYYLSRLYGQQNDREKVYQIIQEYLPLLKMNYEKDAETWRGEYATILGSQSFYTIFTKDFEGAEKLAREGIEVDSTQHFIQINYILSQYLSGKCSVNELETVYREYKDELKDGCLEGLRLLQEAGVIPKEREEDVERIKRMLEE